VMPALFDAKRSHDADVRKTAVPEKV